MPSIHATRWIKNLENSGHELYWYDILKRGRLNVSQEMTQLIDYNKRKMPPLKGEYFLRKNYPKVYKMIRPFLEETENEALDGIIKSINPDVIHSFEMQSCSYPILRTMNNFPEIPWIYSCWGSDLFYFQNIALHKKKIKDVLSRIDYLQTDCLRDLQIATTLGFVGKNLPVVPGGSGYNVDDLVLLQRPIPQRKIILVKGYEHNFGRALNVIKALENNLIIFLNYEVIVFGAHPAVVKYIFDNNLPFKVFDRDQLAQDEVLLLMGKSLLYIGNSTSDGIPNTLLEAIVMGAFPIQSNPGNATAEIIEDGVNGLLIQDPENIAHIASVIIDAVENFDMIAQAQIINHTIALKKLDFEVNKQKVLQIYRNVEKRIKCE